MTPKQAHFFHSAEQTLSHLAAHVAPGAHLTLILRLPGNIEAELVVGSDPDLPAVRDVVTRTIERKQEEARGPAPTP